MGQLDFPFIWSPWQPISKIVVVLCILPSLESNNNIKNYENITQIPGQDRTKELANQICPEKETWDWPTALEKGAKSYPYWQRGGEIIVSFLWKYYCSLLLFS